MKLLSIAFLLIIFSCTNQESIEENERLKSSFSDASLSNAEDSSFNLEKSSWVCYHPGTSFHNKKCVEEEYPYGCYVKGNQSRFCWLLHVNDCEEPANEDVFEACIDAGYL